MQIMNHTVCKTRESHWANVMATFYPLDLTVNNKALEVQEFSEIKFRQWQHCFGYSFPLLWLLLYIYEISLLFAIYMIYDY